MLKFCFIILLPFFVLSQNSIAQKSDDIGSKNFSHHLGIGLGLTYGTLGGRYVFSPVDVFGLSVGLGYNLVGLGYNFAGIFSIPSKSRTQVYLSGMYGCNAVIRVEGAEGYNDTYSGISFGAGVKLNSRKNPGNYWDLGLIVPIRSTKFSDDWDAIKNNPSMSVQSDPWPVLLNVGYNFRL